MQWVDKSAFAPRRKQGVCRQRKKALSEQVLKEIAGIQTPEEEQYVFASTPHTNVHRLFPHTVPSAWVTWGFLSSVELHLCTSTCSLFKRPGTPPLARAAPRIMEKIKERSSSSSCLNAWTQCQNPCYPGTQCTSFARWQRTQDPAAHHTCVLPGMQPALSLLSHTAFGKICLTQIQHPSTSRKLGELFWRPALAEKLLAFHLSVLPTECKSGQHLTQLCVGWSSRGTCSAGPHLCIKVHIFPLALATLGSPQPRLAAHSCCSVCACDPTVLHRITFSWVQPFLYHCNKVHLCKHTLPPAPWWCLFWYQHYSKCIFWNSHWLILHSPHPVLYHTLLCIEFVFV